MADSQTPTTPPGAVRKVMNVTIESTGRVVAIDVPLDVSEDEILEFVSWLTAPSDGMRDLLGPPSPIVMLDGHRPPRLT
jgi:hypothetical protein